MIERAPLDGAAVRRLFSPGWSVGLKHPVSPNDLILPPPAHLISPVLFLSSSFHEDITPAHCSLVNSLFLSSVSNTKCQVNVQSGRGNEALKFQGLGAFLLFKVQIPTRSPERFLTGNCHIHTMTRGWFGADLPSAVANLLKPLSADRRRDGARTKRCLWTPSSPGFTPE